MRTILFLAALACATPALAEPQSVGAFSAIEAKGRFRVEALPGPRHSVEIEGAQSSDVAMRVANGELRLWQRTGAWFGPQPATDVVVHVRSPRFERIVAARGAEVSATGLGATPLKLVAAMGGQLTVDGEPDSVDATAAMGGVLTLAGRCGRMEASAAMGGVIDAKALACADVDADAAMGGQIEAQATRRAGGSAAMGGMIDVSGGAPARSHSAAMGGQVDIH